MSLALLQILCCIRGLDFHNLHNMVSTLAVIPELAECRAEEWRSEDCGERKGDECMIWLCSWWSCWRCADCRVAWRWAGEPAPEQRTKFIPVHPSIKGTLKEYLIYLLSSLHRVKGDILVCCEIVYISSFNCT